ncbi:EB domain and Cysteine-rich repeat-containing protein [Strongyloides ratti]|uniref:EB domain and Cysteine-rich repeat-containing protein n=1 Tax=Strongyloides ratti TaxID=34506 RepID=A0A090KVP7_STRRB|nr:EB domain and Cysteine-rich repeat-containing protein [Strongyloides ratti]CEF59317.1 EB domain and Cysteine-rich repeat-containing protein [Strongyloides ratti]
MTNKYEKKKCFILLASLYYIILTQYICYYVYATNYSPCDGKSQLSEPCDKDIDCELKGSICLRSRCRCHPHYVEVTEKNGKKRCIRLPSKIGAQCNNSCREPLFCRNGICQCVQRGSTTLQNGECIFISNVGDRCSRHTDCTAPFSACLNSQCVCISGTVQQGNKCVASTNCPLGGMPVGTCTRKASKAQVYNFIDNADDCPSNMVCITAPDSPIGHCCPKVCPLGTTYDSSFHCDIKSNATNKCPSDTHFCHRLSDGHFVQSICCRRPCNAYSPKALYLNGECVQRGQLNSQCTVNDQCGGSEGMQCVNGYCQCSAGFHPSTDILTHAIKNPSQLCIKDCKTNNLSRDTTCHEPSTLGRPCFVQEQCPKNSGCYRGRCQCRCKFELKGDKCVMIEKPTTERPQPVVIPGFPQGQNGGDIIGLIGRLFGGAGQGLTRNG